MTIVSVNPTDMNTYGKEANGLFADMVTSLKAIVTDVEALTYTGANAKTFKQECSETVTNYVKFMNGQLGEMCNAIGTATRSIEETLGGQSISIAFEPVDVNAEITQDDGELVQIDTQAFDEARTTVSGHFDALTTALNDHQTSFNRAAETWQGNAATTAAGAVETITKNAVEQTETVQQAVSTFMSNQSSATSTADGALTAG